MVSRFHDHDDDDDDDNDDDYKDDREKVKPLVANRSSLFLYFSTVLIAACEFTLATRNS